MAAGVLEREAGRDQGGSASHAGRRAELAAAARSGYMCARRRSSVRRRNRCGLRSAPARRRRWREVVTSAVPSRSLPTRPMNRVGQIGGGRESRRAAATLRHGPFRTPRLDQTDDEGLAPSSGPTDQNCDLAARPRLDWVRDERPRMVGPSAMLGFGRGQGGGDRAPRRTLLSYTATFVSRLAPPGDLLDRSSRNGVISLPRRRPVGVGEAVERLAEHGGRAAGRREGFGHEQRQGRPYPTAAS